MRLAYVFLLWTHKAMPVKDRTMPAIVPEEPRLASTYGRDDIDGRGNSSLLRLITFPSTHQSPITVNRKASVLTMGTVRLSSARQVLVRHSIIDPLHPVPLQEN